MVNNIKLMIYPILCIFKGKITMKITVFIISGTWTKTSSRIGELVYKVRLNSPLHYYILI